MARGVFADEELQRLREFPEISREELFRCFTLSPADLAFDIDAELAQLGPTGCRPLRVRDTLF
ncbi:hypothetical protein AB4305_11645 [Nocardia sp. 2YAB30]|uniref:hypothetical protein n=1 Tax=unclassified Nocardia TaxID=2637762 RepID=UPI003F9955BC